MNAEVQTALELLPLVVEPLKGVTLSGDLRRLKKIQEACRVLSDLLQALVAAGYSPEQARERLRYAETMEKLAQAIRDLAVLRPGRREKRVSAEA